jgi:broad specificity phosphatase PhoE
MNTIYLIRHGENTANITKEFSHKKVDYSLTHKGVLQAEQTAAYFLGRHIDEIYSSPLKRAYETARIIAQAKGLPVTTMENFREVNVGALEDRPPTDENWRIYAETIRDWYTGKPHVAFPEGENLFDLERRLYSGLEEIVRGKDGKHIIVVGHGGIFIAAALHLFGSTVRDTIKGDYRNCAISEIEIGYVDGVLRGSLKGWGFCSHISGEAAEFVPGLPESLAKA